MLITDHINLTFQNVKTLTPQLYRHSDYYDPVLRQLAISVALKEQISLQEGIYCGVSGPSYETVAEVKMLRKFGADAVGMSTVNEVVYANNLGMHVLGFSCITNLSSDLSSHRLSHEEVTSAAAIVRKPFNRLIRSIINAVNKSHRL
jgi:purine-nucleoside phosphorylase